MATEPYNAPGFDAGARISEFLIWNVSLTDVKIAAASAPFGPINGCVEAIIWCPLTRSDALAIYALVMADRGN